MNFIMLAHPDKLDNQDPPHKTLRTIVKTLHIKTLRTRAEEKVTFC